MEERNSRGDLIGLNGRIITPYIPDEQPSHRQTHHGVVPGYAGHIPRAKDAAGSSAHGVVKPNPDLQWGSPGITKHVSQRSTGPRARTPPAKRSNFSDFFAEKTPYRAEVNGVVPGYTGHQPRAKDLTGESAFGALNNREFDGPPEKHEQGGRRWDDIPVGSLGPLVAKEKYTFREDVNGVIPGYQGHRSNARTHIGKSAYGGMPETQILPRPGSALDITSRAQTGKRFTGRDAMRSGHDPQCAPQRSSSPRRSTSPRGASPRGASPQRRASSPRAASPEPRVVLAKATTQRERSIEERPHRMDRRAVVSGSTFHVPRARDVVGTTTKG